MWKVCIDCLCVGDMEGVHCLMWMWTVYIVRLMCVSDVEGVH